jgi:hypothetical protein
VSIGIFRGSSLPESELEAAEWRIEPLIGAAADFDDNATLDIRTDREANISGYIIRAQAKFAYASETTDFFVTPKLLFRNYDDATFDGDEQFLRFDLNRDMQSSNFRLRGRYGRELVRTAERADTDLEIEDPDEIPDDETGRVSILGSRDKIQIVPTWTYRVSKASSFAVRLDYTDVQYDEVFADLLQEYTNARANISYLHAWSPRNTAILTGTYRQYEAEGGNEYSSTGFNAGFERALSETTQFRAALGMEDTEREAAGSDLNWVADVSLVRRLQTITVLAQYRRTISGGGAGTLSARDQININFTRRLNDYISAGLGVRAYQTNPLDDEVVNFDERNYVQLRALFTWNMTRTWFLQADYRYTILDRVQFGESANSNNVTIWLNYRPTPITRSR